jgi:hypothetical protein
VVASVSEEYAANVFYSEDKRKMLLRNVGSLASRLYGVITQKATAQTYTAVNASHPMQFSGLRELADENLRQYRAMFLLFRVGQDNEWMLSAMSSKF